MSFMKLKSLSVFFPAYNEQDNIAHSVTQALNIIPNFAEKFEIIVVNDGSTDNTAQVLEELSREYPLVRVVTHQKNKGYGGALKSGFAASRYDYIFFTDGDGQFDLREIDKLIRLIQDTDIAAGIRVHRCDPMHRRLNAKAYNILVQILFGLKVKDIDCAFKLIKKEVLSTIGLKADSQFISAELLIKAKKKGFRIRQCPVTHLPRAKGTPTGNNPKVVIKAFCELFRLWRELKS
jgi:glycosyltransferase involved in cell wall biosynthesis